MATTQVTSSQTLTENLNNFIPTGFKFFLDKIPNVSYFCQAASLPGLTAGISCAIPRCPELPSALPLD